jgi:phosphate transport system substrate-binding protein
VMVQRTGRSMSKIAILALTGALALAACGSDNNSSNNGNKSSNAAAAGKIGGADCAKGSITASGSSAQENAMLKWIKDYQTACSGATINYQSVGSGAGITQFTQGSTAFAGSDSALKDTEQPKADQRCAAGKAVNLPMVTGPIAVAYNLQGVDSLVLDAPTLAQIFAGKVKTWNDPAIKKLNADASLPSTPIQPIHRSDSSGTTDNFTKYLAAAAPSDWTFGNAKEWKAPGGQGAAKSAGVTQSTKTAQGAITYIEWSFAKNASLGVAKISTGEGDPVELTGDSAGKAVAAAKIVGTSPDLKLKLDYATKAAGAYPIILVTYEITCDKGLSADQLKLTKSFLTYTASDEGQKVLADLNYAPLPSEIATKVRDAVTTIS